MIYEFHCETCDKTWDEVQRIDDDHDALCPVCGRKTHRSYTPLAFSVEFRPGYDPGLGEYVETKRQQDRILGENNLRRVKAYG